jgi:hypothetical protein
MGWRPAPSVLGHVTKWGGKANLAVPSGSLPPDFRRRRQLPFDGCFALKIWRPTRQPKRVIGPSHLDLATWFSRLIPHTDAHRSNAPFSGSATSTAGQTLRKMPSIEVLSVPRNFLYFRWKGLQNSILLVCFCISILYDNFIASLRPKTSAGFTVFFNSRSSCMI